MTQRMLHRSSTESPNCLNDIEEQTVQSRMVNSLWATNYLQRDRKMQLVTIISAHSKIDEKTSKPRLAMKFDSEAPGRCSSHSSFGLCTRIRPGSTINKSPSIG